ncbi:MAG: MerR family transcriptional regulator [Pseudomonadota bacterium]
MHSHNVNTSKATSSISNKSAAAFRTISEVANELDVQQHVLRFWETKFSQVKPMKRGGGRRYYRPEDVELLKAIHNLLYEQGYTIKGVQKLLSGSKNKVLEKLNSMEANEPILKSDVKKANGKTNGASKTEEPAEASKPMVKPEHRGELQSMLEELKSLRSMLHA